MPRGFEPEAHWNLAGGASHRTKRKIGPAPAGAEEVKARDEYQREYLPPLAGADRSPNRIPVADATG